MHMILRFHRHRIPTDFSTASRVFKVELLAANGRYAQMWALQQSAAE